MSLDLLASLFETPPVAIDATKQIIGFFSFSALIVALFTISFSFLRHSERRRWFIDRSFRFALWAAAWCCVVLVLRSLLGATHEGLSYVAVGPIVLIVLSLFVLALLEIPVVWVKLITDVLKRIGRRD
ncbi:hypothetical protein NS228_16635 [Methylobacterium indicum]|uniref:hypothetical protein n=1 Tax=Methylobacterium indicum TaxID=1775910 RepID=UPI00073461B9|nr:hypothetical protein [Methylobacterium indicum]KTS24796.1 hypothetical protein NS229_21605 [Methylobacterium indicum]KTS38844.1 hypothetical protein NS228_16635 [Methylobacterium indicum]KTS53154.1 hypothetical protein NS230_07260 [Methylobacterium indicum]